MNNSSLWIIFHRMRLPFIVIVISYAVAMLGFLLIPGLDDKGQPYHLTIFDAFYFVTYTATTIGFGELPYTFTHAQRIWATVSIYFTVIGWFYGVGTLVALLQDKLFLSAIAINKFKRSVKHLKENFIIILGYNETTSQIIKKMLETKIRVVVIEKNQLKADELVLEGYVPDVPVLVHDVHNPTALEYAGIKSQYCKGIISLFENDVLNLRVTLASKLLNPNIKIAVRSSTSKQTNNLLDAGAIIVENPFEIIASQIDMALNAPSLLKLENWLYQLDTLESKTFSIPKDNIILCGYGRLGQNINKEFIKNNIEATIIELDGQKVERAKQNGVKNIIQGDADDKYLLLSAGIENAKLAIVITDDDTSNLSIVSSIKKLNKKTLIIARENELDDLSIFSYAKIDHLFVPSQLLIHKTTNALINPLNDIMIRLLNTKDEQWGQNLLSTLSKTIDHNPKLFELIINKNNAIEIYNFLKNPSHTITFEHIRKSLRDRTKNNNILPLLLVRGNENILLPEFNQELKINDRILFACDENAQEDLEYIANNVYEFHYIMTGKIRTYFGKFISRT